MKVINLGSSNFDAVSIEALLEFPPVSQGRIKLGTACFPAGVRHPEEGLNAHPEREMSYILEGAFTVHLADGDQRVEAGQLVIFEPGEAQGSTALEDSRVLYFLQD